MKNVLPFGGGAVAKVPQVAGIFYRFSFSIKRLAEKASPAPTKVVALALKRAVSGGGPLLPKVCELVVLVELVESVEVSADCVLV